MIELERLKLELNHILGMSTVAQEEAKIIHKKIVLQRIQEVKKVKKAKIREEMERTIVAQEKGKSKTTIR